MRSPTPAVRRAACALSLFLGASPALAQQQIAAASVDTASRSARDTAAAPADSTSKPATKEGAKDAQKKGPVYSEGSKLAADKNVGYGSEASFLTWHGYLNFEYFDQQGKVGAFDNHEFYLSAQATVSKKVSITAEFEYEHTPEKLVLPIQAYGDYKASNALTFRVGLFYTPLGLARTYNLRGNRNRMIRQVAVTHDIMFENWSEMGVNVFGEFKNGLYYDLAVGNGMNNTMATGDSWFDAAETLQDHSEDNNRNKAVHGKLGYHNTSLLGGELNVGVSAVNQEYDALGTKGMTHRAADFRFLHKSGLRFQGEWMGRSGDDLAPMLAKGIAASADGWYAQVSKRWAFTDKAFLSYVEPVFQVDEIDLNTHAKTSGDQRTSSLGLIFSPESYYQVKFEYDWTKEKFGAPIHNNKLWASVVLEF
jgi:hypothetical protein